MKEEIVVSHMTWDGIGRDKPVEISKLQEVVDTQCRIRFNKSALGKILGCNRDTAYNLLLEDKEYSFLLRGLDPTGKNSIKRDLILDIYIVNIANSVKVKFGYQYI